MVSDLTDYHAKYIAAELTRRHPSDSVDRLVGAVHRGGRRGNAHAFSAETEELDGWAEDLKVGLEREIKEIDRQVRDIRRGAAQARTLEEKVAIQKQILAIEGHRNQKRRSLFDVQDQIDRQRDELIQQIETKLLQRIKSDSLFIVRWTLAS